jgi:3-methyladenine DNA glycosylase AlkD
MDCSPIIQKLKEMGRPESVAGMARYGISTKNTLGVSMPEIRRMAKEHRKDHELALCLWNSGIHEARIMAALVDDPLKVTEDQADRWVHDLDSWDVCDQLCGNLLDKIPCAYSKAKEWSRAPEEFVRRAGFALMTQLAVHDKRAEDSRFIEFLPLIMEGSTDERNFVKKAVNWALRQIGKKNRNLNRLAIETALAVSQIDSRSARWIASDALRELRSDAVQARLSR